MSIHNKEEIEAVLDMAAAYKEIIEAKDKLIEQLREDKDTLLHQRARNLGELAQLRMVMELTGWDKGRPW
jgi:hypothetical protein